MVTTTLHPPATNRPKRRPKDGTTQKQRRRQPTTSIPTPSSQSPSPIPTRLSKTRVFIKNLPPRTTEQDLKEFLLLGGRAAGGNKQRVPSIPQQHQLQITDCKVLRTAKGKSRNVAFVGFRTSEQASFAIETFHRSYLNMTRITVEAAVAKKEEAHHHADHDVDDPAKKTIKTTGPSPTSSSANEGGGDDRKGTNSKNDDRKKENMVDQKVEEFLNLMGGSKKSKFWSNDDDTNLPVASSETQENVDDDEDDDNDHDSSSSSSSSSGKVEEVLDDNIGDNCGDQIKLEAAKASNNFASSDLDFLRSKQTQIQDFDDAKESLPTSKNEEIDSHENVDQDHEDSDSSSSSSAWSSDDNEEVIKKIPPISPQNQLSRSDTPRASENDDTDKKYDSDDDDDEQLAKAASHASKTRLFVRNLAFETTEEELEEYFSTFGKVMECHIPVDDQKRNKGYAFVTFEVAVDAMEAKNQLDKVDFQGRLLHIMESRPPPTAGVGDASNNQYLTWKQKQELARKEAETKKPGESAKGWSASFVRGDAVVDTLAERLGLRKGDLLDVKDKLSSGDAAVRLALGETQIIEENREYFRAHGVDMDALVSAGGDDDEKNVATKRSKTAILVKNLPFDTKVEELMKLFHVGAEPLTILLPPSRTIAMVEYGHSTDAKRAFRNLAYRRFKHVPIYLEWAPLKAVAGATVSSNNTDPTGPSTEQSAVSGPSASSHPVADAEPEMVDEDEAETGGSVSSTLYVKNLNFVTTEDALRQTFESHAGKVLSVRIPQKVAPTKDGNEHYSMSMGYGFVELASPDAAKTALRRLQGKLVDGHALELAISSQQRTSSRAAMASSATGTGKNRAPTKLVVRNVPFQATRQELLKLFGSFGQLRKVRLPKKFDGSHRGFAFVEFLTGKEALAAMTALSRTHLYGRHLVLEWASNDGDDDGAVDVGKLRDKAKRDTAPSKAVPQNKRIRFD